MLLALMGAMGSSFPAFLLTSTNNSGWDFKKHACSNSQLLDVSVTTPEVGDGGTFLNPYIFNWRTNEEKLLCLKNFGSICLLKSSGLLTINDRPEGDHLMSLAESSSMPSSPSTILYSLATNPGTEPKEGANLEDCVATCSSGDNALALGDLCGGDFMNIVACVYVWWVCSLPKNHYHGLGKKRLEESGGESCRLLQPWSTTLPSPPIDAKDP